MWEGSWARWTASSEGCSPWDTAGDQVRIDEGHRIIQPAPKSKLPETEAVHLSASLTLHIQSDKEDNDEDVKRVCGDKRCPGAVNMITGSWQRSYYVTSCLCLLQPAAPPLAGIMDLLLLWVHLCREPPTVLCMCERQTTGRLCSQFSRFYLLVMSEKGWWVIECSDEMKKW